LERAKGVKGFERESVRAIIRQIVLDGFAERAVRRHPTEQDRRIIPFKSGDLILYLSLGPNTTTYPADVAVIGVLYAHELIRPGAKTIDVALGDVAPQLRFVTVRESRPKYVVFIGRNKDSIEYYLEDSEWAVEELLKKVKPPKGEVAIYELKVVK
jgi:hypothetical protein